MQIENKWEPGVVTDHANTPRSYHVRTEREVNTGEIVDI